MTGFLTRLAARTLGQVPLAQPLQPSRFSSAETFEASDVMPLQEGANPVNADTPGTSSPSVLPSPTGSNLSHLPTILTKANAPLPKGDTASQQGIPAPERSGQSPPSMGVPPGLEAPGDLKLPSPTGIPSHPISPVRPPQFVPAETVEKELPVSNPASAPASREPFLLPATDTPYPDPPPLLVGTFPSMPFLHPTKTSEDSPALPGTGTSPPAGVVRPVDAQPRQELGEFARRAPGLPPQQETLKETSPTFRITIGRVEVRAISPPQPISTPPPRPRTPSLSLNDYLKQRNHGK